MLRLVFEAVMVIAVVSCLYFMIKLGETGKDQDAPSGQDDDNDQT